jgi:hypothetical protein
MALNAEVYSNLSASCALDLVKETRVNMPQILSGIL